MSSENAHCSASAQSRNTRGRLAAVIAGAALVVLAGCGHEKLPEPKAAPAPQATTPALTSAAVPAQTGTRDIGISPDLLKECKIHIENVEDAPKFDFDRAELQAADRNVLDQVAKCVTTGPLKGRALSLTGRADARGESEYNFALGEHRASSVTSYLKGLGVDPSKLRETSRGELDATGTDETGWARDRRVDIGIAP